MPSVKKPVQQPVLHKLSQQEITDPYLVIDELFDFADLPDIKELLWGWLKITVTGTYHKNLSATERSAIIDLYEKLEKLVEAVQVIHTSKKIARKGAKAQSK
jgi:hypothetical protein